jgi:hypothetical protein
MDDDVNIHRLAVAVALVTGFTAANTVPLSRAGVSKQALDVNQLARRCDVCSGAHGTSHTP